MQKKFIIIISSSIIIVGILAGTLIPLLLQPPSSNDLDPPVITILNPFLYEVVSGTTEILFEAEDIGDNPSGIATYEILINDLSVSNNFSYVFDSTIYADGTNLKIIMRATDNNGNLAEKDMTIVVDNTENPTRTEAFKVIVFNAWNSGTECTKLKICEDWLAVLYEEDADIILVSETGTFDNSRNMEIIINKLSGHLYQEAPYTGFATSALAVSDGVAVISRYPILEFHDIPEYRLDDNTTNVLHRAF